MALNVYNHDYEKDFELYNGTGSIVVCFLYTHVKSFHQYQQCKKLSIITF